MNWDRIAGNWKEFKGKVKEKWGKLTDDDLTAVAGKRDQLAGRLQQRYGYGKDQAERELDEFARSLQPWSLAPLVPAVEERSRLHDPPAFFERSRLSGG